jgi:hypothetical protein
LVIGNTATHRTYTAAACNYYVWNTVTYTVSGTYVYPYINQNGIASADTLHLTIYPSATTNVNVNACSSYTLPWGGDVSSSGTYSHTYSSIHGCDSIVNVTVTIDTCYAQLNLKVFLEGFYDGMEMRSTLYDLGISSIQGESDSILVNLWSPAALANPNPNYTSKVVLHADGTANVLLPVATNGNAYYLAVKHRNSIETWSASPVTIGYNTNYDFTTGLDKAYNDGVNAAMISIGNGMFAFYGGDVNQDGTVDGSDMNDVDNNTSIAAFGYDVSDANGDGATDGLDMNIVDNNTRLGLFFARPY